MTGDLANGSLAANVNPLIDVLIPVLNGAKTIRSSIESILMQTERRLRIIVVNDGSTDGTSSILSAMAKEDNRITVIDLPNGGIVKALNTGLKACSAPFVARHDADDIAFPQRLARQAQFLMENPDYIAVGANAWHIDAAGRRIGSRTFFTGDPAYDASAVPSIEPYIMHPFLMARREYIEKVGGYRHVIHAEDTDLYWRLIEQGRLFNLPEILGEYRMHGESISSTSTVNGRIAAVYSQLAALSYRRRAQSACDLEFNSEMRKACEQSGSLQGIIEIMSARLSPEEAAYLRVSSAVKLLSLVSYRPYQMDAQDLVFVREAIVRGRHLISHRDALKTDNCVARVGLQLLVQRRWANLWRLRPGVFPMSVNAAQYFRRLLFLARNRRRFRRQIRNDCSLTGRAENS